MIIILIIFEILKDVNLTWYSDNPDFTPCFEQTVLVWIPCAFLWLFCLFDFYYLTASLDRNIPWNKLNVFKLIINLLLLLLMAADLVAALVTGIDHESIHPLDIWMPIIKFATFVSNLIYRKLLLLLFSFTLFHITL